MATREELIASDKSVEEVCETIEADSLAYLSVDAVAEVLEKSRTDLCLGCVTGEYPYDIDGEATDRDISRPVVGADAPADD